MPKCTCLLLAVAYVHLLSALGPLYNKDDLVQSALYTVVFLRDACLLLGGSLYVQLGMSLTPSALVFWLLSMCI